MEQTGDHSLVHARRLKTAIVPALSVLLNIASDRKNLKKQSKKKKKTEKKTQTIKKDGSKKYTGILLVSNWVTGFFTQNDANELLWR